jgi:ankyrin repeat protein
MNQVEPLQLLLQSNADPRLEDGFGRSAIDYAWIAVFENSVQPATAKFLKEQFLLGAKDELDEYSLTPLHRIILGVLEGSVEDNLQDMPPSLINATDGFGKTALLWASRRGDLDSVKRLLRHGADPNISDHMRRSPLHMAARSRNVEVIHELIKFDADPLADNFISEKPAHYAAYEPNGVDLLRPFFKHGMEVEQPSKFGRTLLDIAVQWNYPATVRYLIGIGADRDGLKKSGIRDTPLGRAILYGFQDVIELLLELKVDINHVDVHGDTYMHLLALHAETSMLELFHDCQFTAWLPDVLNEKQKTPLNLAEEHRNVNESFVESFVRFIAHTDPE